MRITRGRMSDNAVDVISAKKLLDEIIKTRRELKNSITASETRLILEIQNLKNRINNLEEENLQLREQLEQSNRNHNKNNIIVFGLKKKNDETITKSVCDEISQFLDVKLEEFEINDLFKLGKTENSPIKIELISHQKKRQLLKTPKN